MIFYLTESGKRKIEEMNGKSLEIGADLKNMLK
jgi:hypothetical protein